MECHIPFFFLKTELSLEISHFWPALSSLKPRLFLRGGKDWDEGDNEWWAWIRVVSAEKNVIKKDWNLYHYFNCYCESMFRETQSGRIVNRFHCQCNNEPHKLNLVMGGKNYPSLHDRGLSTSKTLKHESCVLAITKATDTISLSPLYTFIYLALFSLFIKRHACSLSVIFWVAVKWFVLSYCERTKRSGLNLNIEVRLSVIFQHMLKEERHNAGTGSYEVWIQGKRTRNA